MAEAISNTSPLLYLHRIGVLDWLPVLFSSVRIPQAVVDELEMGRNGGYDVPLVKNRAWLQIVNPLAMPSEWLAVDLGPGEVAAMALAVENPASILLLDDLLARRLARAAGLTVWGTLKVLLEAKSRGLTKQIEPHLNALSASGMWLSAEIRQRVLKLAGEDSGEQHGQDAPAP